MSDASSFSERMRIEARGTWSAILGHRFFREIATDAINDRVFARYLRIEYGFVDTAARALGYAVANLITLFAPPKVIIAGRAMASSEHFMRPLRETVAALVPPSLADVTDLVTREWDDSIWARGAAAMTLRELYGAPWGTTGPAPLRALVESRDEA